MGVHSAQVGVVLDCQAISAGHNFVAPGLIGVVSYQRTLDIRFLGRQHWQKYYDVEGERIRLHPDADPKDVIALQAADVFAYEILKCARVDRPVRYPYKRLDEIACTKYGAHMTLQVWSVQSVLRARAFSRAFTGAALTIISKLPTPAVMKHYAERTPDRCYVSRLCVFAMQ